MRAPLVIAAMAALAASASASAAVVAVGSAAALAPNDSVEPSSFGPIGFGLDTPQPFTTVGGRGGAFASSAVSLSYEVQGVSYFGDLPGGTDVILQPNSESSQDTSETVTVRFDQPVFGLGATFDPVETGGYVLTLRAFDAGANLLGDFAFNSASGTTIFAGVLSTAADIAYVTIRNNTAGTFDDAYAFTAVLVRAPEDVPAPAGLALLGLGLGALALRRR